MHYLYILYSKGLDKYYVGETIDFKIRFEQQNAGFYIGSYSSQTKDWVPELIIEFDNITQARKAEIFIKNMKSKKFIESLIKDPNWFAAKFKV